MDRVKWVLIVVIRVITFGIAFRPDPKTVPIDAGRHKEALKKELEYFEPTLTTVRAEKTKAEDDKRKLEDLIAAKTLTGQARREALLRREELRKDIVSLAESETDLEENIAGIKDDQRIILRYERAKARDRSPEMDRDMQSISGRIRERRQQTTEQRDKASIDESIATDANTVDAADDHLNDIEQEVCELRERERATADLDAVIELPKSELARDAAVPTLGEAARDAIKKDDPDPPPKVKTLDLN